MLARTNAARSSSLGRAASHRFSSSFRLSSACRCSSRSCASLRPFSSYARRLGASNTAWRASSAVRFLKFCRFASSAAFYCTTSALRPGAWPQLRCVPVHHSFAGLPRDQPGVVLFARRPARLRLRVRCLIGFCELIAFIDAADTARMAARIPTTGCWHSFAGRARACRTWRRRSMRAGVRRDLNEAAANPALPRYTLKTPRFLQVPVRNDAVAVTQQVRDGLSSEGRYGLTTPGVNRLAHVRSG